MGKRGPKPKELVNTKWSANLAYAMGLIATDGCLVRGTYLVDLTSKDKEQLNNFNKCIGVKLKIGIKGSQSQFCCYRVQIKNKIFYNFLLSIGFTPAKSKTIREIKIPEKYYFDFLRGCFDGDGCFYSYWDPRWRSSFMFYTEFCSASPKHLDWIRKNNSEKLSIKGHITKDRKGSTYQLKYAKKEALVIIGKMYYGPNVICLSRKRTKIMKVLEIERKQQLTYI